MRNVSHRGNIGTFYEKLVNSRDFYFSRYSQKILNICPTTNYPTGRKQGCQIIVEFTSPRGGGELDSTDRSCNLSRLCHKQFAAKFFFFDFIWKSQSVGVKRASECLSYAGDLQLTATCCTIICIIYHTPGVTLVSYYHRDKALEGTDRRRRI